MTAFPDDDDLRLHAYLDGECNPDAAHAFERRLAGDEALRLRYEQMLALRKVLRVIPQEEMPETLRARVSAAVADESPRERQWSWRALAAAVIVGELVSAAAMLTLDQYRSRQELVQQKKAKHKRRKQTPQPNNKTTTDSHVVR